MSVAMTQTKPAADTTFAIKITEVIDSTHTHIELLRIWPEPFRYFLQFDFVVLDQKKHHVKITVVVSEHQLMFYERVPVYTGRKKKYASSTIDFFMQGVYSIQVNIDGPYKYFSSFKRNNYSPQLFFSAIWFRPILFLSGKQCCRCFQKPERCLLLFL